MEELLFKIAEAQAMAHEFPNSREKSMLITKLDEARLWAKDMKGERPDLPEAYGMEQN